MKPPPPKKKQPARVYDSFRCITVHEGIIIIMAIRDTPLQPGNFWASSFRDNGTQTVEQTATGVEKH